MTSKSFKILSPSIRRTPYTIVQYLYFPYHYHHYYATFFLLLIAPTIASLFFSSVSCTPSILQCNSNDAPYLLSNHFNSHSHGESYRYLIPYPSLIFCNIVCHGLPSQRLCHHYYNYVYYYYYIIITLLH